MSISVLTATTTNISDDNNTVVISDTDGSSNENPIHTLPKFEITTVEVLNAFGLLQKYNSHSPPRSWSAKITDILMAEILTRIYNDLLHRVCFDLHTKSSYDMLQEQNSVVKLSTPCTR